jgi:hypothetical protein
VFTEEMNLDLEEIVYEPNFLIALSSMQKGKILGHDCFTMNFFISFYELLKEDLLMVVRGSQKSRKMLGDLNSTFLTSSPKNKMPKLPMVIVPYHVVTCSIN